MLNAAHFNRLFEGKVGYLGGVYKELFLRAFLVSVIQAQVTEVPRSWGHYLQLQGTELGLIDGQERHNQRSLVSQVGVSSWETETKSPRSMRRPLQSKGPL